MRIGDLRAPVRSAAFCVVAVSCSACGGATAPEIPEPIASEPVLARIELSDSGLVFLTAGSTRSLRATLVYSDSSRVQDGAVSWRSSDSGVASVAPDGTVVAVSAGSARITAASGATSLSADVVVDLDVTGRLVFIRHPNGIFASRPDGSDETLVTERGYCSATSLKCQLSQPVWSPDGTKIAFVTDSVINGNNHEITVVNADGSDPVNLTNHPAQDRSPTWSPDGSQIAFVSDRDSPSGASLLYLMGSDGSNPRRLGDVTATDPAWSPAGGVILFDRTIRGIGIWLCFWNSCSWSGGGPDSETLYVVSDDGSTLDTLAVGRSGAWSKDGTRIAFYRAGVGYLMNADGSGETRRGLIGRSLTWSPSGRWLASSVESEILLLSSGSGGLRAVVTVGQDPDWSR